MFTCHRHNNTSTAYQYLCGLVQSDLRNMERIEERVPDVEYEALQQFISSSPWDAREVMGMVALEADKLVGGTGQTGLLIDETAINKKGRCSVGVTRQWNGRLGKVDNCQVAVCGVLSTGDRAMLVDMELFLPESWTNAPERCLKAGVPDDHLSHLSKPELALRIVRRQREAGVRFDYVCADGLYGNSGPLCRALDDEGETFMLHVHADRLVYLEDPRPEVPPRKSGRGRPATKLQAQSEPVRVDALFKTLTEDDFERLAIRRTTKGLLEVNAYRRSVWVWDGEEKEARRFTLYIRRDLDAPNEVKYCLSNASEQTPLITLGRMEAQRFWVEHSFEEAKGQVGMAEYQVRGWLAWHHHMALVMMALLFLTKQRMLFATEHPLMSCHDIKIMLAHFLPKRDVTYDEVLRQMEVRHAKRRAAAKSAARRRAAKNKLVPI